MDNTTQDSGLPIGVRVSIGQGVESPSAGSSWIQKTPGVCGGRACVRNTRITVWGLVEWKKMGLSDERIMESVAGLTADDLQAAWDFYAGHPAEIEQDIRQNEEA